MTFLLSAALLIGLPALACWRGLPVWGLFAVAAATYAALALPVTLQLWALSAGAAQALQPDHDTYYVVAGFHGSWTIAGAMGLLGLLHFAQARALGIPAPRLLLALFWLFHLSLVLGQMLPRMIVWATPPRRYIDFPDAMALAISASAWVTFICWVALVALLLCLGHSVWHKSKRTS